MCLDLSRASSASSVFSTSSSVSTGAFQYNGRPIEPWQINTQEFGGRWGSCPCEKKAKVAPSTVRTLEDFVARSTNYAWHVVESIPQSTCFGFLFFFGLRVGTQSVCCIANEAIAACRVVNSDIVALIHLKIRAAGGLDLTVRTADPNFTDQLLGMLAHAVK